MNTLTKEKNYKLITLILVWSSIVIMSSLYMTIPLIDTFSNYFNISNSKSTLTSSIFSVFFAIGCLFYGSLSNKYGRKKVILIGLVFLSIFSFLAGLSTNINILIIFRALQGISAATFSSVALAYIMDNFPNNRKTLAIGFISTGFLMAGILGQDISMIISSFLNWNYVFFIFTFIYFITLILIYLFVPKLPPVSPNKSVLTNLKDFKYTIKLKNLKFAYIISFVILFSFVYMYTSLNSILVSNKFSINNNDILWINFLGIIGMFFSPFSNILIKKFTNIITLRFSIFLSVISLLLIAISNNIFILIFLSITFVLGIALAVPALISLIGLLSKNYRATALSLHTFILFLGTALAPILSTYINNNVSFLASFICDAIILSFGILATFIIKTNNL